jgi:aldehyde dehydrogenase (NAD+)
MTSSTIRNLLARLHLGEVNPGACSGPDGWGTDSGQRLISYNPTTGQPIAQVIQASANGCEATIRSAQAAFARWRETPAPKRGLLIYDLAVALREAQEPLGELVTLEVGKIRAEGIGEVQEMIDICDFATGLSRQLYGLTMPSERPEHRMFEQWHPLGVVGVISAFNFPVAVWSWNTALAAVCGDSVVWKPASGTPLTAIACTKIAEQVCRENDVDPAIFSLTVGKGSTIGDRLLRDRRIPLVSATGSCQMGYRVGSIVGERLGRTILELGGNNAIIVTPSANMDMALRAILFGAVGTAGQRCTSTRRIIVHESVREQLVTRLVKAYKDIKIGDPRRPETLMGPLVTHGAVKDMMNAVERIKKEGGKILFGGERLDGPDHPGGHYVTPCIADAKNEFAIVQEETFAPILYIIGYGKKASSIAQAVDEIEEALALHNGVPQGLSSSIFTDNYREAEIFLSPRGSDCGIANVNIGTSGAEIGGAFGGEKETGGGRESGSDSWKVYMRRQTNTVNYGATLPLAQGIKFGD